MGQEEELEPGLSGLFASGPADDTDIGQPNAIDSSQAEPAGGVGAEEPTATETDQAEQAPTMHTPRSKASPPSSTEISERPMAHLVVFALSDEQYGVGIDSVESIIRPKSITAVPRAPDFVEGVTNLRGTVLPVVNLHRRFGLPEQNTGKDTRIIVAESDGNKVGMMVDAVLEVRRVPEAAIEPPSPLVTTVDSAFITGIAKVGDDRLIILLDLEQVLAHQRANGAQ